MAAALPRIATSDDTLLADDAVAAREAGRARVQDPD